MKPRLLSSKKWTPFPSEYVDQIRSAVTDSFQDKLNQARFVVEGRIYPEEIIVRLGYALKDRLQQCNFEVSCQFDSKKQNALEIIHACIDAAGSVMLEFVDSNEEMELPREWAEFDFNKLNLFLQFTTVNTELERSANELLGAHSPELVDDSLEESDDALDFSEVDKDLIDNPEMDPTKKKH